MEQNCPEYGTLKILLSPRRLGHLESRWGRRLGAQILVLMALLPFTATPLRAQRLRDTTASSARSGSAHWWQLFAGGFASSVLAHEGGHIVAAYVVGGRPTFGLNEGRPTIYSGIDANLEPGRQFVFSSAGLTVQSVLDEAILDAPHRPSSTASAFERGVLAGGIATSFFYVTVGRTGSVSDVDFMARTSRLSKTSITAIYGGVALLHSWRIAHNGRYAHFFARPGPFGEMRVGVSLDPSDSDASPESVRAQFRQ
jgi:hypothetical protein